MSRRTIEKHIKYNAEEWEIISKKAAALNQRTVIIIAIYHLEAKIISRGEGRSAVAAAAYMSCDKIYNDYDGIQHDYTKKQGLVWEHVFLPQYAPPEWKDHSKLWNAVEESERAKDSRLAREFVVALPKELNKAQWKELLSEFIGDNFVSDGMCADVAVHDTDGHNPHAIGHKRYNLPYEEAMEVIHRQKNMTSEEFMAEQEQMISDYVEKYCKIDRVALMKLFNNIRYGK